MWLEVKNQVWRIWYCFGVVWCDRCCNLEVQWLPPGQQPFAVWNSQIRKRRIELSIETRFVGRFLDSGPLFALRYYNLLFEIKEVGILME